MKFITVMSALVLVFTVSLIPASAQVYVPLVTYEDGQQNAATSDTVAAILALLQEEEVDPATIEAVRAELQAEPSANTDLSSDTRSGRLQTNDGSATYTGCLLRSGIIINVAVGDQPRRPCSRRAQQISWNQQGAAGEQGSQGEVGPVGPQGETGPQGTAGVLGFYTRVAEFSIPAGVDEQGQGVAYCEEGDIATGGGFLNPNAWNEVVVSRPETSNGWRVRMQNKQEFQSGGVVFTVCADVTP